MNDKIKSHPTMGGNWDPDFLENRAALAQAQEQTRRLSVCKHGHQHFCGHCGVVPKTLAPSALQRQEVDPYGVDAHAPGSKLDAGKVRPWLMVSGFAHALAAVADVTTKGAIKYTPHGWASVADGQERYMEGFTRHLLATARGETHDTGPGGTGCLHKAQMIWNLLASLELELRAANGWGDKS